MTNQPSQYIASVMLRVHNYIILHSHIPMNILSFTDQKKKEKDKNMKGCRALLFQVPSEAMFSLFPC